MDEPVAVWRNIIRYLAEPNCISDALENALIFDDRDEFVRLIKLPDFALYRDSFHVEEIFHWDAASCYAAVLNGEAKGLIDIKDLFEDGFTPLSIAAITCKVNLTKYLLQRGDTVDAHSDLIHTVIKTFLSGVNASRWTPHMSVYELLVVLCHSMRSELEVLRMLVQNTQNKERVRQTFMDYADKRELLPVALLLLAAPELFLSSDCVIREVASSSVATLYHLLYSLEKRTDIEEAMLLLVDALAMADHKFVAYTRLPYPNSYAYLRSYLDVAFLVREVARNKQGLSSPDDYFLRFFKPVRPEADQLNIPGQERVQSCVDLPFELKRHDLDQAYINMALPSLTPEDADCLNKAIKKKLLVMPSLYGHLEDLIKTPKEEVKFPLPRYPFFHYSAIYQSTQQPLAYTASAKRGFGAGNTPRNYWRNKNMKPAKLNSLFSGISQFSNIAKRFIK